MKVRRLIVAAALLACAVAGSAGWLFMRTRAPSLPSGGWQGELGGGRTSVRVWQATGTAASAAAAREAEYVSEGWTPLPVSTPTFKLLLRGHDLAAILAEDLPDGTTVTELLRNGVL